jgi:predicted nucleic acid-binding protein
VKASAINYIVDAGPLIAVLDGSDQWHHWAMPALESLGDALFTTEAVLSEVCHRFSKHRPAIFALMDTIRSQQLQICPVYPDASVRIEELMKKYERMDFADGTLVALSERYPHAKLITIDRTDFTIYRRNDGKPVPTIMPALRV